MSVCGVSATHVSPPRPMEVKKLMAKRVFLGLSRGKRPSKNGCKVLKGEVQQGFNGLFSAPLDVILSIQYTIQEKAANHIYQKLVLQIYSLTL